jgi:carbonic anhydrase/acetyltransferase-like protein (isoleucine patch superfamily)
MVVRSFDGIEPTVDDSAYIDETAVVIGDVEIGENASIWPGTVLRGDDGSIEVGEGVNLQDNAVCHEGVEIEPYATIGHTAIVHAARIGERSVVGMSAVVLDDSEIGHHSIVAAGSVVTEDTEVPPYSLVAGTPAEVKTEIDDSDWFEAGDHYVELAARHQETSEDLPEKS